MINTELWQFRIRVLTPVEALEPQELNWLNRQFRCSFAKTYFSLDSILDQFREPWNPLLMSNPLNLYNQNAIVKFALVFLSDRYIPWKYKPYELIHMYKSWKSKAQAWMFPGLVGITSTHLLMLTLWPQAKSPSTLWCAYLTPQSWVKPQIIK